MAATEDDVPFPGYSALSLFLFLLGALARAFSRSAEEPEEVAAKKPKVDPRVAEAQAKIMVRQGA